MKDFLKPGRVELGIGFHRGCNHCTWSTRPALPSAGEEHNQGDNNDNDDDVMNMMPTAWC